MRGVGNHGICWGDPAVPAPRRERLGRDWRTAIAQTALAFEQRAESQNGRLIEPLRHELNTDRQVLGAEAVYHRKRRQASEIE